MSTSSIDLEPLFSMLIPTCLPETGNPNWRRSNHWYRRYQEFQNWEQSVVWLIRSELPPGWEPLTGSLLVSLSLNRGPRRRVLNFDNAAARSKPLLDALTHAGVWIDDDQVVGMTIDQPRQTKEGDAFYPEGSITVTLYRANGPVVGGR